MKLVSLNLNGIRSATGRGLTGFLKKENPDIVCFQEIKAVPDQIGVRDFEKLGYSCRWYSAFKRGYSGTALLSRAIPDFVSKGIGVDLFDSEGRVIRADFGDITVVCAYFPSGSTGEVRQAVKMNFLQNITEYVNKLKNDRPKIILGGDFNICHKPADINNPNKHLKTSGFLPEEREWFDSFIASGWTDTFREFCSESERYSWWSYRSSAKSKNLGWRIDYFLVTDTLKPQLQNAEILDSVILSDHCPVTLEIRENTTNENK
ncbi:MAG: exodeoxyribonuclease III [Prevotellaceae bacterium]|jgi:exodeoxyribonuclease-3|nr:exodeoxyribonuclease III [Prevotellaceae bacterium]